jgi:hypothetical protein
MFEVPICPECKVPKQVSTNRTWLNNGDIVQTGNEGHRSCFVETENLDPIYASISKMIGFPIGRLVIRIAANGNRDYVRAITSEAVREMVLAGSVSVEDAAQVMFDVGKISGYGVYELIEYRLQLDEDDYFTFRLRDPYSFFLACGSVIGGFEAVAGENLVAESKELGANAYEIRVVLGEHEEELDERLEIGQYRHLDGDIELKRCQTCGAPAALRSYWWDVDAGIIRSSVTGRRMALVGPYVLDSMFKALENELGENITRMAVEAQRVFVKGGPYSIDEIRNEEDLRTQLAVRGFGNLQSFEMKPNGLQMTVNNAANCLLAIGMAQGLFELAYNTDSNLEWELSEAGNLRVKVTPSGGA